MAGQIAGLIKTDTQSCDEIIQELMKETTEVLQERANMWGV